jgi:hypothetical protein
MQHHAAIMRPLELCQVHPSYANSPATGYALCRQSNNLNQQSNIQP